MGKRSFFRWFILTLFFLPALTACGSSNNAPPVYNGLGTWTWVSGSNLANIKGVYGLAPLAVSSSNLPGGRQNAVSWTDTSGNRWLFGGLGYDSNGAPQGYLNDLWKFDGTNWTWVSGTNIINQKGVYGAINTPASTNIPGARGGAISWYDGTSFWLFGGFGYDTGTVSGVLNDLWKFNATTNQWTWVSGANTIGAKTTTVPGARYGAVSWYDGTSFWLFGGNGLDSAGIVGDLSDLWKFDGSTWTLVAGVTTANTQGIYTATPGSNFPGARHGAVSWYDGTNKLLWLFGGNGLDSVPALGALNDLWKFNLLGTQQWTWISGASTIDAIGVYGSYGSAAATNVPGARRYAVSWFDPTTGNLWLYGGDGYDSVNNRGYLNDLWTFNPTLGTLGQWTWYNGSAAVYATGNYGTLDIPAGTNVAGARGSAVVWFVPANTIPLTTTPTLWLFGGWGVDATGTRGWLNDLWEFQP